MPVNKLQRFAEIKEMDHVIEYTDFRANKIEKPKGRWNTDIFKNKHPITLELGCGKAATTTVLAKIYPDRNFIGVDLKGARLWKGAKQAEEKGLKNVQFLRAYIEHINEYFAANEVAEIWITFPDPWPRPGDRDKRLTSPRFLEIYRKILAPGAAIHFKTDDDSLFDYTLQTIESYGGKILQRNDDIQNEADKNTAVLQVQTSFEKKHLANQKKIKYCKFLLRK